MHHNAKKNKAEHKGYFVKCPKEIELEIEVDQTKEGRNARDTDNDPFGIERDLVHRLYRCSARITGQSPVPANCNTPEPN